jgi:hypothetical protein
LVKAALDLMGYPKINEIPKTLQKISLLGNIINTVVYV